MIITLINCILAGLQIAHILVAATIFFHSNYVPFDIIPVGIALVCQNIVFCFQIIYNRLISLEKNIISLR